MFLTGILTDLSVIFGVVSIHVDSNDKFVSPYFPSPWFKNKLDGVGPIDNRPSTD